MGCAPSKQNAERENDPDRRPLSGKDKKSPKARKSPKKDRAKDAAVERENAKNNNAKDGAVVAESAVVKAESRPVVGSAAAPDGARNGTAPVDRTDAQVHNDDDDGRRASSKEPVSPSSPIREIAQKYGELWDLSRGMPPPTSPYDDGQSPPPPPKPDRLHHHTFPRSRQKQRSPSDREDCAGGASTLERKISLRERTPDRRKDLDVSGNVYLGKSVEPPGRGRKIDAGRLEFLSADGQHDDGDDREPALPTLSVRERAQTYLERVRKTEERKTAASPIRRPVRKLVEDDSGEESGNKSFTSQDGNISIIEVVNKEILEDYHEVEKKTFEEIEREMRQRAAEEAERKEEEERRRAEEEERERIRQEEEEAKRRAEEEERERIRQEEEEAKRRAEEEEQERIRQEEEEEAKRRAEEEEQERIRKEEEERMAAEREAEQERMRSEAQKQENDAETEGGEVDPAEKGAQIEDRFYNNKAFEKPDIDASNPEQQEAALKIQTKYRQHHAKEVVKEKREEQAAIKIQAGYRGWHDRKRVKELKSHAEVKSEIDAQKAHEDDTRGDTLNYDNPEVVNAATTIQAGFKGYKARKQVQELKARRAQEGKGHDDGQKVTEPEEQVTEDASGDKQVADEADKQVPNEVAADDKQVTDDVAADNKQVTDEVAEAEKVADEPGDPEVREATDDKPATEEVSKDDKQTSDDAVEDKQVTDNAESSEIVDQYPEEQQVAATKIQAGVRGYLARKQVKAMRDGQATSLPEPGEEGTATETTTAEGADSAPQADVEPAAAEAEQTQDAEISQQKEDEVKDTGKAVDYNDPEVEKAATKIQAGLRGMQARKKVKELKQMQQDGKDEGKENEQADGDATEVAADKEPVTGETTNNAEFDFDPNDPEVNKAASKIQAGFKGYKTRKEIGSKPKGEDQSGAPDDGEKPAE